MVHENSVAAGRINSYAQRFQAAKYLEIGVSRGNTFFSVNMPLKVAVDPDFRFDPKEHAEDGVLYLTVASDEFFATFSEHPGASLFMGPDGHPAFDVIYIDGLHTFGQSLRDFENSLKFCHRNTIWIMDDTVPSDVFSSIPDQKLALESRKLAGGVSRAWHGDVFKTLLAIHDFHLAFSYCTVMGKGNPQTVLWQAPPLPERKPRFSSLSEIASLGYLAILEHADLFLPVNDALASVLIGKSLATELYAGPETWKKMLYARIVSKEEIRLKSEVENLRLRFKNLEQACFLSRKQKALLWLITPFVKKLANTANFQRFKENPAVFFQSLKSRKYRIFGKIFFPRP